MEDRFGRQIEYLRVSVTDRCNLRCIYCMPAEGLEWTPQEDTLTFDELEAVLRVAAAQGVRRVRLTGGEPTVRSGLVSFARRVARIPGIEDLAMTTNGLKLLELGQDLYDAGIQRLNISMDTLDPGRFRAITRVGDLDRVLAGIEHALDVGFEPVKINAVVMRGINDDEWSHFADLTRRWPVHVRFIELMPLGESALHLNDRFISVIEMERQLRADGLLEDEVEVEGAGPARYYRVRGARGTIGFISALTRCFCASCNRMRISCDGKIYPCLGKTVSVDLKPALRPQPDQGAIAGAFRRALHVKPEEHEYFTEGAARHMSHLGG